MSDELVSWRGVALEDLTKEELIEALKYTARELRAWQMKPVDYRAMARETLSRPS